MGTDAMILVFWRLSIKQTFSLSSFTFIKWLFSSCSLYATSMVSSVYLKLINRYWYFFPEILIPACASSSPAFLMMYSAYKLNKQGDNIQPWRTLFLFGTSLMFHVHSNSCFLTCIQISQEAGQLAWYSHLFRSFPQFVVIHTVKGFGLVNKAEIDVFLKLPCIFDDPADVGNLISGSSAFSKSRLNIWKFTVHILLKSGLENFEHYFTSVSDESNCDVVGAFFGISFLKDCNENELFQSCGLCWIF